MPLGANWLFRRKQLCRVFGAAKRRERLV